VTSGAATSGADESLPVVAGLNFTAVLVPAAIHVDGSWTPVLEVEPKIQACVLAQRHDLRRTLSRYLRQYSGTTVQDRQVLNIQFFDSRSHSVKKLKQHAVIVLDDPGDGYFSVDYEPQSGKCSVQRFD
jgi:hypothetical protein